MLLKKQPSNIILLFQNNIKPSANKDYFVHDKAALITNCLSYVGQDGETGSALELIFKSATIKEAEF